MTGGYGKNSDVIGAVLLLLLLSGRQGGIFSGKLFAPGSMGLPDLIRGLHLDHFARDMHRLVDMMDQMASLGQMTELMELTGPLMTMLSSQNGDYSK